MLMINAVFVLKCTEDLSSFLEAKNVDFRRRGWKIKTNLVNITRKDGAIDFYFFGRESSTEM